VRIFIYAYINMYVYGNVHVYSLHLICRGVMGCSSSPRDDLHFSQKATDYRALLRIMTYKHKASYGPRDYSACLSVCM